MGSRANNWHLPAEREMMVNKTRADWLKPGDLVDDSLHTTGHITTYTWSTQPRSKALEPDYHHPIHMEYDFEFDRKAFRSRDRGYRELHDMDNLEMKSGAFQDPKVSANLPIPCSHRAAALPSGQIRPERDREQPWGSGVA